MIRTQGITKKFASVTAVNGVDLTINDGEIFGLVGPDGAGKTTLIRMILGIMDSTAGSIEVMGQSQIESVKEWIGYIPQKFSLYRDMTVMENIQLIGSLYGASSDAIALRANEILSFTKLLPFADRLADNLSGGMKQKLALAAGLMHKPKLFFLDEPTTGVDPVSRREFWQMLYRLNKEGMTIVVSTPYMDEAELCTRVAFMHEGKIVSCASPEELREQYPYKILELTLSGRDVKKRLQNCGLVDINAFGDKYHLVVQDLEQARQAVAAALTQAGHSDFAMEEVAPTLEDVFVALAREAA
ncbi:MAG TPA: ABC transporter ATP-binding protein [Negativicutes bacterium]|nr:ABC transporter ATP-binding protein [Negativicutes bacterium]